MNRTLSALLLGTGLLGASLTPYINSSVARWKLGTGLLGASLTPVFAADAAPAAKYNQLVQELSIKANGDLLKFTNPRDGWVRIVAKTAFSKDFRLFDGSWTDCAAKVKRFRDSEMVFWLPAGEYVATGIDAGDLTILAIPETYFYAPGVCNTPALDGNYDWAYLKEHMLSSLTTTSVGHMDWAGLQEFRSYGRRVLDNLSLPDGNHPGPNFAQVADETLKKYDCFASNAFYDGVSFDEYDIIGDTRGIVEHSKLLKKIANPHNLYVYTWVYGSGKPGNAPERLEFMKTATADPLHRMMLEVYCPSQPDEAAAAKYLSERLTVMMQDLRNVQPGFGHNFGVVVGSFNQIPEISIDAYANVDFRYYLDMQLNLIANNPAFKDISIVGYWGCNYVDEDLQRWGMALLRHYFFEGKKEMLSSHYGFTYLLPYLANPEFVQGLDNWDAKMADKDSIFAADCTKERVAQDSMGFWCTPKEAGNRVAVMRKSAKGANTLAQTLTHLVPGKSYMLQYVTFDYYEATHGRRRPRPTLITAELDGAAVTWSGIFTDRNVTRSGGAGRVTVHRVHFTPETETAKLTFTDRDSTGCPGEELAVAFVKVLPRFLPDEK